MKQHDPKVQAEFLEQIKDMFGGAELVRVAEKRDVKIIETDELPRYVDGRIIHDEDGTSEILIRQSSLTPSEKKLTLFHELRHLQQNEEFGKLSIGKTIKMTSYAYITLLMEEADAFTCEYIAAAKDDEFELFNDLYQEFVSCSIEKGFSDPSFHDDAHFARFLFTSIMINDLGLYHHNFLFSAVLNFIPWATLEQTRQTLVSIPDVQELNLPSQLTKIYGEEFMAGTSMRAIQTAFIRMLPLEERVFLTKYKKLVKDLPTISEKEYKTRVVSLNETYDKVSVRLQDTEEQDDPTEELQKRRELLKKEIFADVPVSVSQSRATKKNNFSGSTLS